MGSKMDLERQKLLESLENDVIKLKETIEEYKEIENRQLPEFHTDDKYDAALFLIYREHKIALTNIQEQSANLKTSIENFLAFFDESKIKKAKEKIKFETPAFQIYCKKCKTTNFFYSDNKPPYKCDSCNIEFNEEEYIYLEKSN